MARSGLVTLDISLGGTVYRVTGDEWGLDVVDPEVPDDELHEALVDAFCERLEQER